jgi:pyruvate,water dikinase
VNSFAEAADAAVALPAQGSAGGKAATAGPSQPVLWAVRSSSLQEDSAEHSFAGQFTTRLNVTAEEIEQAVMDCYASGRSKEVRAYRAQANLPGGGAMAVIVQAMVPATAAGVVFTSDPVTGLDTQAVAEFASGLGEDLVQGRVEAFRYRYDWLDQELCEEPSAQAGEPPVRPEQLDQLWPAIWRAQEYWGQPLDLEVAFSANGVHLLQARPITSFGYAALTDWWSTADFRDGGVSSAVYPPLMWSCYDYIWRQALPDFLIGSGMLPRCRGGGSRRAGGLFFGRPYWNLSMVKEAMARVPGYKESEFDSEYGIAGTYDGQGHVTRLTLASIWTLARVGVTETIWLSRRRRQAESLKRDLLETYQLREVELEECGDDGIGQVFRQITEHDYQRSESTYFSQIFLNTVHQSLFKSALLKHTDTGGYLALIGGLGEVSHLAPFARLWELSRVIRADQAEARWWAETPPGAIEEALASGSAGHHLPELAEFLREFGFHSERELDLLTPSWAEAPSVVIAQLVATAQLPDECSPAVDAERAAAAAEEVQAGLAKRLSAWRHKRLAGKIAGMRSLLWWREEFRDVSTRYYHLIRRAALLLADFYAREGVLEKAEDIWFTTLDELWSFQDGALTGPELRRAIARHRRYYMGFRNYLSDDEIGAGLALAPAPRSGAGAGGEEGILSGYGCQPRRVTGRARVVGSVAQIGRLEPGDILVTRFTDTGWTPAFARLGGVVTEYGGVLCHAAIVSREFSIPCVVGVRGATTSIPDGALIEVDGAAGSVSIIARQGNGGRSKNTHRPH